MNQKLELVMSKKLRRGGIVEVALLLPLPSFISRRCHLVAAAPHVVLPCRHVRGKFQHGVCGILDLALWDINMKLNCLGGTVGMKVET